MRKKIELLAIILVALAVSLAAISVSAGDTAMVGVSVVIPEVLKVQTDIEDLVFDLGNPNAGEAYPPAEFPAYYTPENTGTMRVRVFCNFNRSWILTAAADTLRGPGGTLPADRLEWSLDGQDWHRLSAGGAMMLIGNRGAGWQERPVHYRLRVEGDERGSAGRYATTIIYSVAAM